MCQQGCFPPLLETQREKKDTTNMVDFFQHILEFEGLPPVLAIIARGYTEQSVENSKKFIIANLLNMILPYSTV